jgi:hypothetical protein
MQRKQCTKMANLKTLRQLAKPRRLRLDSAVYFRRLQRLPRERRGWSPELIVGTAVVFRKAPASERQLQIAQDALVEPASAAAATDAAADDVWMIIVAKTRDGCLTVIEEDSHNGLDCTRFFSFHLEIVNLMCFNLMNKTALYQPLHIPVALSSHCIRNRLFHSTASDS